METSRSYDKLRVKEYDFNISAFAGFNLLLSDQPRGLVVRGSDY